MAPWVAAYDWTKGSLLVTGGTLVEVGPAQKWNGGKVLHGEIEELMGRAGIALESLVRTATGVVCGLAAADEWLAARVSNPALVKRAVVGEMEEEYKELAELMSAVGCMWVQEGRCDWAADDDDGAPFAEATRAPVRLRYRPDDSDMSDVEEAPAVKEGFESGHVCVGDLLGNPHGKRVGRVTKEVASDIYLSAKHLFEDGPVVGGDHLDEAVGRGKGKEPVTLGDEISEMSVDGDSVGGDEALFATGSGGTSCTRMCGPRMEAMGKSLGRMEAMLGMLMAGNGLASPDERLAAEKRKGRMAREWDVSVARATERAKAEGLVKAAEKSARKRAVEDERAEEARVQQEEQVKVKEAARAAAVAEKDRVVEAVKECTEGPALVEAAERVVNAARIVEVLEREVAESTTPVEIGGWQIAGGKKRKTVQVVSQVSRPLDGERRKTLQVAVGNVQGLIGAARLGWGLVASPYTVHGGDEVLWRVRGVELEVNGSDVARAILRNLEAVWGVGSVVGSWVQNKLSTYVVVRVIPEREWLSEKGGVQGLVDGNPGIMWGPRQPTVIGRAWNKVDVKVEIMTAEAARGAVVRGLVYCGMKRTVHMAVGGGGASVLRLGPQVGTVEIQRTGGRPIGPEMNGRLSVRGPPPRTVGTALRRPLVGACFRYGKAGHWKNECPYGGGADVLVCFTCGWKGHISSDCPRRV